MKDLRGLKVLKMRDLPSKVTFHSPAAPIGAIPVNL